MRIYKEKRIVGSRRMIDFGSFSQDVRCRKRE
jgi:hypothetical protein